MRKRAKHRSNMGGPLRNAQKGGNSSGNDGAPQSKKKRIDYLEGLGWSEATQTYFAHFRVGPRTYTCDTGQRLWEDARVWLNNHRRDLEIRNDSGEISGLTVAESVGKWGLEAPNGNSSKKPSPARVKDLKEKWGIWVLPYLGRKAVTKVTSDDIKSILDRYRSQPGPHRNHNENGLRNLIIDINTIFRWVKRRKLVRSIPDLPEVPQIPARNPVIVPLDLIKAIVQFFDRYVGYDIYAMAYLRILAFTGVRTSTARKLNKSQFTNDFKEFTTGVTKNGESYHLPIPEEVRSLLLKIPGIREPGLLFSSSEGDIQRDRAWCLKAFKRAVKSAGVDYSVAWHRLRASYATMMIQEGADLVMLMRALGWKTVEMALIYVNTDVKEIRRIQERCVASALGAPKPPLPLGRAMRAFE